MFRCLLDWFSVFVRDIVPEFVKLKIMTSRVKLNRVWDFFCYVKTQTALCLSICNYLASELTLHSTSVTQEFFDNLSRRLVLLIGECHNSQQLQYFIAKNSYFVFETCQNILKIHETLKI